MTKSCTRPHRAPIGAAASSRAVAAAMTLARDCGRGSGCGHEMRLPAHAPPWPIVGRSSQGRGARRSRAHRLWARRFLKGPNGPAPRGRGLGRGAARGGEVPCWERSRGGGGLLIPGRSPRETDGGAGTWLGGAEGRYAPWEKPMRKAGPARGAVPSVTCAPGAAGDRGAGTPSGRKGAGPGRG